MSTQFRILFTVAVSHGFYTEGCEDFDFIVSGTAADLLKKGRLLAKVREGILYVLFEADDSNAPLVSIAGETVRIGLKLVNPFFSNITEFAVGMGRSKALYRNATAPTSLDVPEEVLLTGPIFSHEITGTDRPVTVTVENTEGHVLLNQTIVASENRTSISCDLTGQPAGVYTVEEVDAGATETIAYFVDAELQQAAVFGIVEIKIDTGFYTTPAAFSIGFDAREETLNYYVVARNYSDADFNQLTVADEGTILPKIVFTKIPSSAFTDAEVELDLLKMGGDKVVLFRSQVPVARRDRARQKLQLKRNTQVVVNHLPQPAVDKANSDLIIHISKP